MALGYPLGQSSLKSTTGVVSGREHLNGQRLIQMSAAINPGSSGGPVLNSSGQVIGISQSAISGGGAQNVAYIVPVSELKIVLDDMYHDGQSTKLIKKAFGGVLFCDGSKYLCDHLGNPSPGGIYVSDMYEKSSVKACGVCAGDMIYQVDGHDVDMFGDMFVPWSEDKISIGDYVNRLRIGEKVSLVVYRNGERLELELVFRDDDFLPPVRAIYPGYEKIDYENIGGIVIMPMTINHIALFSSQLPHFSVYKSLRNQRKPFLVVTNVFYGSEAHCSLSIGLGTIVKEINGKKVESLSDFRQVIKEEIEKSEHFVITTEEGSKFAITWSDLFEDTKVLADMYSYPITPFVQDCIDIMDEENEEEDEEEPS